MKLSTTLLAAATTLAAFVSADMIQINNPTAGTVWTAGVSNFVGWTGNCASMGAMAKNVTVILNTGPSEAVRYVATLGTLDCSSSSTRTDLTVPLTVTSGTYSIVVRTVPELSYTNMFTINNPSSPAAPEPATPTSPTSSTGNGGSSSGTGSGPAAGGSGKPAGSSGHRASTAQVAWVGLAGVAAVAAVLF
ncbi:hypothetical protein EMPS_08742 [Entomortierella parvispora]|uniref:Yeast cell wall synthesis Kre9/Knh1-like N-terminal domain-containing protein n=1 Tax=Entomortierella parvispora TaxID=205924 RepID=A0A9P3HH79_9FUNG|nr:hypothetical protein EMPS_08742 [Entomortierella parvispora]